VIKKSQRKKYMYTKLHIFLVNREKKCLKNKDWREFSLTSKTSWAQLTKVSAVGSLTYIMVCTKLDISHAVGVVSRYMSNSDSEHWNAVRWILRYLVGTKDMALCYTGADIQLCGFVDSDMAGDIDSRKSTTGYVFTLGGASISWVSRLQKIVALSTTEAEYVAAVEACKEMTWL
jgi:hypothetical protein